MPAGELGCTGEQCSRTEGGGIKRDRTNAEEFFIQWEFKVPSSLGWAPTTISFSLLLLL